MNSLVEIGSFSKIRRGASPRPIGDPKYFGGKIGWIRISDVTASNKYLFKTTQYVSTLGESLSVRVEPGDLIMSICATIGRPVIIGFPACIHDGFVQIYDIKGAETEYLYYILQFHEKDFEAKGQPGTQINLNTTIVEKFKIYLPNETSQRKITSILSSCDAVIDKTEASIAKYKSIKQGMLQDLFTRGIDLNTGKLRPKPGDAQELYKKSEIGLIPNEWNVTDILTTTYLKGRIGWHGLRSDEFIENGPYLITGTDFKKGRIDWSSCYHISEERFQEAPLIHIKDGDVLITKDGTIGKLAFVERCPSKAILNSGVFVMRCKDDSYNGKYLFYLLNSEIFQKWLRLYKGGSTILHLYQREFERFNFPLPIIDEQNEIVKRLDSIENKISEEENCLYKYKSIKSGLMNDLLTGKVEVNTKTRTLTKS